MRLSFPRDLTDVRRTGVGAAEHLAQFWRPGKPETGLAEGPSKNEWRRMFRRRKTLRLYVQDVAGAEFVRD
jgi:hypothetical protein